jgi:hypothetical protein
MNSWSVLAGAGLALAGFAPFAAQAAAINAVQYSTNIFLAAGAARSSVNVVQVPAGKRLVVQNVSFNRSGAESGSVGQAVISTGINSVNSMTVLPNVPASGFVYSGVTQTVTLYSDAGTYVQAFIWRSSVGGPEEDTVTITGYLAP